MSMSAAKPPIWIMVAAELRADRRKTAVLVLLLVVMAVIYVRWFLRGGSPASVAAGVRLANRSANRFLPKVQRPANA